MLVVPELSLGAQEPSGRMVQRCGSQLSDLLSLVCSGHGYHHSEEKRGTGQ